MKFRRRYYSVASRGMPDARFRDFYFTEKAALRAARQAVDSADCAAATVHECESISQARTVKFDVYRFGERRVGDVIENAGCIAETDSLTDYHLSILARIVAEGDAGWPVQCGSDSRRRAIQDLLDARLVNVVFPFQQRRRLVLRLTDEGHRRLLQGLGITQ